MKKNKGYKLVPLDFTRKMVRASLNVNKKNVIHCLTEMDVTSPRKKIKEYYENEGEKISFTAFIIRCLALTLQDYPEFNSFIRGSNLILLEDITISVLIEREIDGKKVPEPLGIANAGNKSLKQIHTEIRNAQNEKVKGLGDYGNMNWIKYLPVFLLKTFVRLADRNISLAKKYGKVAVTAVGMYAKSASWFIPHGSATVLLTVGSIKREGQEENLCLTASFDHEIVDGSPAARFLEHLSHFLEDGDIIEREFINLN